MRAVRFVVVALFVLLAGPISADDWVPHADDALGYVVELPSDYGPDGTGSAPDTLTFRSPDGEETLTLSGGTVLPGSFNDAWTRTRTSFGEDGWTLSYKPVPPNWTSFTGQRGNRRLFVKMIPLCGGTKQYAMLALEYPADREAPMAPKVERLAASLRASGTGSSC